MKDINEALSTLLLNNTMSLEDIGNKIREELKNLMMINIMLNL